MEIVYSPHARSRMLERHVSTEEVESILLDPDGLRRQSRDKIVAYKKVAGRADNMLAVVAVERGFAYEVVTVMTGYENQA